MQKLKSKTEQLKQPVGAEIGTATLTPEESRNAEELVNKAVKYNKNLDTNTAVLASCLYELNRNELYRKKWGFDNFKEFVDKKIPNCGHRKAFYLVAIFQFIKDNRISKDIIDEVGWSKLKEIVPILKNGASLSKWIQKARTMSRTELQNKVREFRNNDPIQQESARKLLPIRIEKGDIEIITENLEYIAEEGTLDTKDKGRILVHIVQDWYDAHFPEKMIESSMETSKDQTA